MNRSGPLLETRIQELETKLLDPFVRSSKEELDRLIADDFLEFGSSGRVWTKHQVLAALTQEPFTHYSISDFQVRSLGPDHALATYRVCRWEEDTDQRRTSLRSSVWRLVDGRWKILFHQGTNAPER